MKQLEPTLVPLPCPFCGEIPKISRSYPDDDGDAWGWVYCDNWDCVAKPSCVDGSDSVEDRGHGYYADIAIKRWNTRV